MQASHTHTHTLIPTCWHSPPSSPGAAAVAMEGPMSVGTAALPAANDQPQTYARNQGRYTAEI